MSLKDKLALETANNNLNAIENFVDVYEKHAENLSFKLGRFKTYQSTVDGLNVLYEISIDLPAETYTIHAFDYESIGINLPETRLIFRISQLRYCHLAGLNCFNSKQDWIPSLLPNVSAYHLLTYSQLLHDKLTTRLQTICLGTDNEIRLPLTSAGGLQIMEYINDVIKRLFGAGWNDDMRIHLTTLKTDVLMRKEVINYSHRLEKWLADIGYIGKYIDESRITINSESWLYFAHANYIDWDTMPIWEKASSETKPMKIKQIRAEINRSKKWLDKYDSSV